MSWLDALRRGAGAEPAHARLWRARHRRHQPVRADLCGADHDRHPQRARRLGRHPHAARQRPTLVLRGRAAWVHDFDPGRRINAAFQTLPGASFTVDGAAAPRDSALASAVAEMRMRSGVTLIGKVDGEFAAARTPTPAPAPPLRVVTHRLRDARRSPAVSGRAVSIWNIAHRSVEGGKNPTLAAKPLGTR